MRLRKLTETDINRLAVEWLQADTEGKKELLKKYDIAKPTLYRTMKRYGIEFKKIIH
ncbi:hypothetical protein M977_04313 [Buttiauxella gaviniae ATCC 51604]|uniref:Transposase n=1 Tax=Buttiauxella gaviniae ATCC 51604 TaxID=1354253 RepID=A0A1B7HN68_9ENTR|nr:hypothetical protein [Buttiauxella gaviniae]OAT17067.1 hypothetical protein M977_04313 [Buttiauxella gaviniae ATCC 51604]